MENTKEFAFYQELEAQQICNMKHEISVLTRAYTEGRRLVIYGRRNVGKTSLVKNVIIPNFLKHHKDGLAVFCDFLKVQDHNACAYRLRLALQEGFRRSFPKKAKLIEATETLKKLRPSLQIDPVEGPSLSLTTVSSQQNPSVDDLFFEIKNLAGRYPLLLAFDEFQDIAHSQDLDAIMRKHFESIGKKIPIFVMGSKKHMLAKLFARPKAPLAGWGEDLEIKPIPYEEYNEYIRERFAVLKIQMPDAVGVALQNLMQRIPESINILCDAILRTNRQTTLSEDDVFLALRWLLEHKSSRYEELLSRYTSAEQKLIVAIGKMGVVQKPTSREFLSFSGLSIGAIQKAIKRLEDDADIYRTADGFELAEPLLTHYVKRFR